MLISLKGSQSKPSLNLNLQINQPGTVFRNRERGFLLEDLLGQLDDMHINFKNPVTASIMCFFEFYKKYASINVTRT